MEIHLAPETEMQLRHMAVEQGKELPQVVEETLALAFQLFEDHDLWLSDHRNEIQEQIFTGLAELDRGDGIPDAELDAALAKLKSQQQ